jgi:predicted nuclease with TOPRIM domain
VIERLVVQDAELEAMKAKLADMEKEAAKLQEMQVRPRSNPASPTLRRRRRRFPSACPPHPPVAAR